jgi:hypothetical protein
MRQALDALEGSTEKTLSIRAMKALRERLAHCDRCGKRLGGEGDIHTCTPDPIGDAQDRLIAEMAAQPEQQEPYGWVQPNPNFNSGIFNQGAECPSGWVGSAIAVHTNPPAAQQIDEAYALGYSNGMTEGYHAGKAHAAAQPAQQEPVAFFDWYDNAHWGNEDFKEGCHRSWNAAIKYTSPPAAAQRQWVELTPEEIQNCYGGNVDDFARALLAKSKERNT